MEHDIVAVGDDQRVLVMQLFRRGLDEFEEPLAPWRDMSTVLDIGGRPETLGRGVVPLVKSVSNAFKTNALFCVSVVVMVLHLLV